MSRSAEDGEDISSDESWYGVEVVDGTECRVRDILHLLCSFSPVLTSLLVF